VVASRPQVRTSSARFSLASLLVAVSFVALLCTLSRQYGIQGLIASFDLALVCLGMASVFKITQMWGMRVPRLTLVEYIVLLAVCAMFHGLALPAISTGGHRRRAAAPVTPQAAPALQDDNASSGTPGD
jgi:hypothetical protein